MSLFFKTTATTEIYTLSLHDALPIFLENRTGAAAVAGEEHEQIVLQVVASLLGDFRGAGFHAAVLVRSEEHTSELQSHSDLVCRLLLEKKKTEQPRHTRTQHALRSRL